MSDDIFRQLFELFDQPGPINWKLAAEVGKHLVGERVPIDPNVAEEYQELAFLAQHQVGDLIDVPIRSVDLIPADPRGWMEKYLDAHGYLGVSLKFPGLGGMPVTAMEPALLGMQIGSLVGAIAASGFGSFDGGYPPDRQVPLGIIVPATEDFAIRHDLDPRQVRLWVVTSEIAYRAITSFPWLIDKLGEQVDTVAGSLEIDPSLGEALSAGFDPQRLSEIMSGSDVFSGGAAEESLANLEAVAGSLVGRAALLAERALAGLVPEADRLLDLRLGEREETEGIGITTVRPLPAAAVSNGRTFWEEVARRYGDEALLLGSGEPDRLPLPHEVSDPVAWAARVLLDDLF